MSQDIMRGSGNLSIQQVRIVDIDVSFGSLVFIFFKAMIALAIVGLIPAFLIGLMLTAASMPVK